MEETALKASTRRFLCKSALYAAGLTRTVQLLVCYHMLASEIKELVSLLDDCELFVSVTAVSVVAQENRQYITVCSVTSTSPREISSFLEPNLLQRLKSAPSLRHPPPRSCLPPPSTTLPTPSSSLLPAAAHHHASDTLHLAFAPVPLREGAVTKLLI
ncbi:hypothetical protein Droror1_Dr00012606 [Drosera rotundifolia]